MPSGTAGYGQAKPYMRRTPDGHRTPSVRCGLDQAESWRRRAGSSV